MLKNEWEFEVYFEISERSINYTALLGSNE